MSKHEKFILTPITTVLEEAVIASRGIGCGLETYPLCDYILQSILLKMTGFQEQKLRCITWEIATHDFDFRRKLLNKRLDLGEYSTYNAKNTIYTSLYTQISCYSKEIISTKDFKKNILNSSIESVKKVFDKSNLALLNQRSYNYFLRPNFFKEDNILINKDKMFNEKLKKIYQYLYDYRNKIAHNTSSYQQNLPDFRDLINEQEESRNYFIWFTVLVIIDNIFIEMYKLYQELLKNEIY